MNPQKRSIRVLTLFLIISLCLAEFLLPEDVKAADIAEKAAAQTVVSPKLLTLQTGSGILHGKTKKLTKKQKAKKIFGTTKYQHYKTKSAALKHMVTISIKTWDINKKGKKYTRTWKIKVHKNIASTVKKIFKEIYKGKEKFPIHSLLGFSYRKGSSSEHNEGLAIDINWRENPLINLKTGKVLVGDSYKPGKNPYSIPKNGDVVKAFKKYGFKWGRWSTRVDYMHFSYFGN